MGYGFSAFVYGYVRHFGTKPLLTILEKIKGIGESLTTTFSAQLTTLPIILEIFGKVGVLGENH